MMETGYEIFFFLLFVFLAIYAVFLSIVSVVEYFLYKKEMKKFKDKFK